LFNLDAFTFLYFVTCTGSTAFFLSVGLYVCLCVCLSVYFTIFLYLSVRLSVSLSMSVCTPLRPSVRPLLVCLCPCRIDTINISCHEGNTGEENNGYIVFKSNIWKDIYWTTFTISILLGYLFHVSMRL
jgi:hypothetical protein